MKKTATAFGVVALGAGIALAGPTSAFADDIVEDSFDVINGLPADQWFNIVERGDAGADAELLPTVANDNVDVAPAEPEDVTPVPVPENDDNVDDSGSGTPADNTNGNEDNTGNSEDVPKSSTSATIPAPPVEVFHNCEAGPGNHFAIVPSAPDLYYAEVHNSSTQDIAPNQVKVIVERVGEYVFTNYEVEGWTGTPDKISKVFTVTCNADGSGSVDAAGNVGSGNDQGGSGSTDTPANPGGNDNGGTSGGSGSDGTGSGNTDTDNNSGSTSNSDATGAAGTGTTVPEGNAPTGAVTETATITAPVKTGGATVTTGTVNASKTLAHTGADDLMSIGGVAAALALAGGAMVARRRG